MPYNMVKIDLKPVEVDSDPPITVYEVVISDGKSEWRETFGSGELIKAFLFGVKAAFSFTEYRVEIPLP